MLHWLKMGKYADENFYHMEFLLFNSNSVKINENEIPLNVPNLIPLSVMPVTNVQKQPYRGVLRKRCSENMQQINRRTPMPKCDFNKVAKQLC